MQLWPKGKEDEHVQSLSKFSRPTRQPLNFCLSCLVDWPRELNQVCSDVFSGHPRMQRFHGNARLVEQVASAQLAWPLAAFFFPLGPSFIGSAAPISTSRAECCKESRAVAVDEKKKSDQSNQKTKLAVANERQQLQTQQESATFSLSFYDGRCCCC